MVKRSSNDKAAKIATIGLLVVFGLVVFHAPLSVFFGQYAPPLLVKSWKEILMVVLLPVIIFIVGRASKLGYFSRDLLLRLILIYAMLHVIVLCMPGTNINQKFAGLAIDLRFLLFFALVFCLVSLRPTIRQIFIKVGAWAGGVSIAFATLQALVLPSDILKHIGYSKETISPYLTVDKNSSFIRINGTLRGPNPLGAFVMIFISLLTAFAARSYAIIFKHKSYFIAAAIALLVVLWSSYSRSALLGVVISLGIIFVLRYGRKLHLKHWLALSGVAILCLVGIFIIRNSDFFQNVIVHNNPSESEGFNSNEGHASSLQDGVARFVRQPLGDGIGSTGSASLLGDTSLIIENQYLFIAHESGWLGLGMFVAIFMIVLRRLYANRRDWLNLGVLASGLALAVIGLIQPVFADDTVSLVWWGLAAVALASAQRGKVVYAKNTN
jgi:O-antigen ligase/polysaccharide polymerase Wzy-like membrane protein